MPEAQGRGAPVRHRAGGRVRRRRRWPWVTVGALVLVVLGWAAWLGLDAVKARKDLLAAADLVVGMQADVVAGDAASAQASLDDVQVLAAAAVDRTSGPHWTAAGWLPWVGPNVRAVQVSAEVVDDLAARVLPDLMEVAEAVDPSRLAPVEGRIDLGPLRAAEPVVVGADTEVASARDRLAEVAADDLWPAVAGPLDQLRSEVGEVAMITATASRAVQLLPPMLGADGPRTYLVLVQNPAEPRATGGVPALVTVTADDGVVSVGEVVSAAIGEPTPDAEPVVEISREERALFSNLLGGYMGDVTFTPDFPRSAQIARALWVDAGHADVDGVLSIEPGAIARILGVTGAVRLSDGTELGEQNAAAWLMNTVYLENATNTVQDALFAEAAARTFAAVAAGQWDPAAMVHALAGAAREDRLMVWSAVEAEQSLLAGTVLAGELRGQAGDSPVIGVFVNDGSRSKIGYYLGMEVTATTAHCRPDGSREVTVTVALSLDAPVDIGTYPPYVAGGQTTEPGSMRLNVLLYAPTGGSIEDVTIEGADPGVTSQIHDGLPVVGKTVTLGPAGTATLEYRIFTGPDQDGPLLLRTTPLEGRSADASGDLDCP